MRPSPFPFWCPLCKGAGSVERCDCDEGAVECGACDGREGQACYRCHGERVESHKECQGEGWKICPRCDSHARVHGLMPWETRVVREGWDDDTGIPLTLSGGSDAE